MVTIEGKLCEVMGPKESLSFIKTHWRYAIPLACRQIKELPVKVTYPKITDTMIVMDYEVRNIKAQKCDLAIKTYNGYLIIEGEEDLSEPTDILLLLVVTFLCPCCGKRHISRKIKYCPDCGAKINEEKEES